MGNGGTAVALLTTQWLLPWILEKWPLKPFAKRTF
jgi:predicted exporter